MYLTSKEILLGQVNDIITNLSKKRDLVFEIGQM